MLNGRKRLGRRHLGLVLARRSSASALVPATPAQAEPDIDDVQARVDRSTTRPSRPRSATTTPSSSSTTCASDLGSLQADQDRQDDRLDAVREQVQDSIVSQYEGQSLSAVGQVVVSDDPEPFLSQLSTMSAFNDLQSQLFADYGTELKALDIRRDGHRRPRAAEIADDREAARAEEKATVDDKLAEAKDLLDDAQGRGARALLASRGVDVRIPSNVAGLRAAPPPPSRYAMAQVGDAYVYGAAGPNAFDCSGLTMMAWAQAGRRRCRTPRAPSTAPARTSPPATCSPATWSSTTARSATSACTSATA